MVLKEAQLPIEIPPSLSHEGNFGSTLGQNEGNTQEIGSKLTSVGLKGLHISVGSEVKQRALAKDVIGKI